LEKPKLTDQDKSPSDDNQDAPGTEVSSSSDSAAISFERVLEVLQKGDISNQHGLVQWSSNYTFLMSVKHEDIELMCVYKPQRGERPLWDFPDGTLCCRERAAFLTSDILGWQLVPPTVLRDGPQGFGSVQFFIDHDPNYHYFEFDKSLAPQLAQLALFDVLINNADRKGGHCVVDSQQHMWGIDHGIAFHVNNKLRTVIWDFAGQPIPEIMLENVQRLATKLKTTGDDFRQELDKLLNEREVKAFIWRINHVLENKHYPERGPGHNYPWPPV
jgi:hypothetical protein